MTVIPNFSKPYIDKFLADCIDLLIYSNPAAAWYDPGPIYLYVYSYDKYENVSMYLFVYLPGLKTVWLMDVLVTSVLPVYV